MITIEVDGIGEVEVDDSFTSMSPEQQGAVVDEIIGSARGGSQQPQMQQPAPQPAAPQQSEGFSLTNALKGAYQRGAQVVGNTAGAIDDLADYLNDNVLDLRIGDGKDGLENALESVEAGAKQQAATSTYKPGTTWEDVKGDWTRILGYAAEQGIVSAPDLLASVGPQIAPYILGRTKELAEQRAQADGREGQVGEGDVAIAFGGALLSAGLDRIGGKGILSPKATGFLKKTGEGIAKEAVTEAVQEPEEYATTNLGTQEGFDPAEALDRAVAGAAAGGISGGLGRAAIETPGAIRKGAKAPFVAAKDAIDTRKLRRQRMDDEEGFQSDARVQSAFDEEKAGLDPKADPEQAFRNLTKRYQTAFKKTAEALEQSGDIDPDAYKTLATDADAVGTVAGQGVNELNREVDLKRIDDIFEGRTDETSQKARQTLRDAAMDLNTVVRASRYKNSQGPAERLFNSLNSTKFGPAGIGGTIGGLGGGIPGALAGAAAGAIVQAGGRRVAKGVDKFLGNAAPEVLQRSRARAKLLSKEGGLPQSSLKGLQDVRQEAEGRQQDVVILPARYHQLTQRRQATEARRETEKQARIEARDAKAEAKRLQDEANAAQAKAEAKLKSQQQAITKRLDDARKAEQAAQERADRAEQSMLDRAQKGQLQFMLKQARDARAAVERQASIEQKAAQQEQARAAKEAAAAQKKAQQLAQKAKEREDQANRAKDEIDKSEAQMKQWMDDAGSTAARLGAPRLGGWVSSTIENASRNTGLQVTLDDVRSAVGEVVSDGRLTKEQADQLFSVRGARINKKTNPGLYYEVQDIAAQKAAQRLGADLSTEGLKAAREKAETEDALKRGRIRRQVAQQSKELDQKDREDRKAAQTDEQRAKRSEAAKKAAATRKANAEQKTKDDGSPYQGIRNLPAYQATVDTAGSALQDAIRTAPKGLSNLATEVASAKTKGEKSAIVEAAKMAHPKATDWIEGPLSALAGIGGTAELLKKAKAKRKVS